MRKQITVTQKDFDKAVKIMNDPGSNLSQQCPNALALKRVFKDQYIAVGTCIVYIGDKAYNLPLEGREVIYMFTMRNSEKPKLPIKYSLEI